VGFEKSLLFLGFSEKGRMVYPLQKIDMVIITKFGVVYLLMAKTRYI
jgi:hypothetical protein